MLVPRGYGVNENFECFLSLCLHEFKRYKMERYYYHYCTFWLFVYTLLTALCVIVYTTGKMPGVMILTETFLITTTLITKPYNTKLKQFAIGSKVHHLFCRVTFTVALFWQYIRSTLIVKTVSERQHLTSTLSCTIRVIHSRQF